MKKRITMAVLGMGLLMLAACSVLTKQETTQSNLPTAATLQGECAAGKTQTPPVRVGACDDFNLVQSGCLGLTNQPLVPAQALMACTANGYIISGNWTPL